MSVSIDARGPRWSALITTFVLALALVTSNVWLIVLQAFVFAIGVLRGPQFTPYAFTVAVGFALAAAFLNAAFNYCLGCQMYLLILRARIAK